MWDGSHCAKRQSTRVPQHDGSDSELITRRVSNDLAPIARYYSRLFAQRLRSSGDHVVRTEVWSGEAPNTPPGQPRDEQMLNNRRAVLQAYYEGVVEERVAVPPYSPYHGAENEADIHWVLEYFEES